MRIGIDVRRIVFQQMIGGIAVYAYNLITHLSKIDKENEYILLHSFIRPRNDRFIRNLETTNFKNRVLRIKSQFLENWLWRKLSLPIELMIGKVDLFHQTYYYLPPQLSGKSISTIHDLGVKQDPSLLPDKWVSRHEQIISATLKRADFIITISQYTKSCIMEILKFPEEKIGVTYLGVDKEYYPINNRNILDNIRKKYNLNKKYILFVGNLDARKNIVRLIEAFYQLKNNIKGEYNLVIVGRKWGIYENIFKKVEELKLEKDVIFMSEITKEDLPPLYSGAEVFILPSLIEGFGIPLIEAMACGTPVITSKTTSMPEVVKDAGILVNPLSVEEIAQAIAQVLTNSSLRAELVKKGLQRAKFFSWDKTARQTLDIYKMVSNL